MKTACYQCPDKVFRCHTVCESYKEFQKQREAIRAARRVESEICACNQYLIDRKVRRNQHHK